jgi:hypothetical protein
LISKYTILRIIIAVLAVSMLVAGPNMALLQQHQGYAAPQTKKQEQNTIQGLRGNLAKRSASQHLNQENQCLRAGKCNNAALGEQTSGNDNSVTGFTDQSKNVQNRVVVTPTPTPPPTLTLTIPILVIFKDCIPVSSCLGVKFPVTVTGNNTQPSSFSLSDRQIQKVTLGPGNFTVTESPMAGFGTPSFFFDCHQTALGSNTATGTISAGQTLLCRIVNFRLG